MQPELWKSGSKGGGEVGGTGGGACGDGGRPGGGEGGGGHAGGNVGGVASWIGPHNVHSPVVFERRVSMVSGEPNNVTTLLADSAEGVSNDTITSTI